MGASGTLNVNSKGLTGESQFEENLIGLEADGVKVETLAELEGDCELGMRKAKCASNPHHLLGDADTF